MDAGQGICSEALRGMPPFPDDGMPLLDKVVEMELGWIKRSWTSSGSIFRLLPLGLSMTTLSSHISPTQTFNSSRLSVHFVSEYLIYLIQNPSSSITSKQPFIHSSSEYWKMHLTLALIVTPFPTSEFTAKLSGRVPFLFSRFPL